MFRQPGQEFTYQEWQRIVNEIRKDLMLHYKVYQRAIVRSSFVCESIRVVEDQLAMENKSYPSKTFIFGLSSFLQAASESSSRKQIITGSTGVYL